MELAGQVESFRKRGIGVASVIPEPVEVIRTFADRHHVSYPILSDADGAIVRRFGLLDAGFKGASPGQNVPFPGSFLIDPGGVVRARYFEKEAEDRRTAGSVLMLEGAPGTGGQEIRADHFTLRTSSSNTDLAPGQRFTLALEFDLVPLHHMYAPGVTGYRALDVRLTPDPLFEVHETRFPEARPYHYKPLDETVPVFEGRFRVLKDVTLRFRPALQRIGGAPAAEAELAGSLEYQVCSDRVCYPPASLPLGWKIHIRPWVK